METQYFIEYELIDPISNRRIVTESRGEAISHFEAKWLVYEHHVTVGRPSTYASMRVEMSMIWNNNPDLPPPSPPEV